MDEQTFRRLAPDAVAGRLDTATYERWKDAAAEDPSRATFVVRVAEADARLSQRQPAAPSVATPSAARVSRSRLHALAVIFAALGLLAGGMVMHSYLKNQELKQEAPAGNEVADDPVHESPAPVNAPKIEPERQVEPDPQPEPGPEPEPEPVPQIPDPPVPDAQLRLVSAAEPVSVRGPRDTEWRRLATGEAIPADASLSSRAACRLRSASVEVYAAGSLQLELNESVMRFNNGRAIVRVTTAQNFSCYKQAWTVNHGSFVVEPKRLGGELYLFDGSAVLGSREVFAPALIQLDGTGRDSPISGELLARLELEALGPHRRLLYWDCETEATRPELGELVQPGALGEGFCVQRKYGQPGIGVAASTEVMKAEPNARLRMRVKTTASGVRLELRVMLEGGFRMVDARLPVRGDGNWQTIDVPLDILRAGRFRAEPGWLPGQVYSAMLLTPAVDPEAPLQRHDLHIDDLLIYVPD